MASPEQLLTLALKSGAEAAEVYHSTSASTPVSFEANRLKQVENIEADGLALRLWRNGQPGVTVAYGAVEPTELVDRALALSDLNAPEDIELSHHSHPSYPALGTSQPVESLVEQGRTAIATIRDASPEVLCSGSWDCETETTRLINSKGLDCQFQDTTLSGYLELELVRGDDFLSIADGDINRDQLNNTAFVQRILQRLEWSQTNTDAPDGKVPVLLSPGAADLLWWPIYSALSGKQVLEKASPWSDKRNHTVTTSHLTLHQNPDFGPFSCPFDDEGSPTQPLNLITNGKLENFYTDRTTAKSLNLPATGNGFRAGLGSRPNPRLCNLIIAPGSQSFEQLITSINDGILLDQILGGGAGISGDFSVNIDLGYRIQNGKIVGRVKDTMVAGNVYDILKNPVILGNDSDWNGSCYTPSLITEGISVTGRSTD